MLELETCFFNRTQVMDTVYQTLKTATNGAMTTYILSQAKPAEEGTFYYDDFLGDGDISLDGKPLVKAKTVD